MIDDSVLILAHILLLVSIQMIIYKVSSYKIHKYKSKSTLLYIFVLFCSYILFLAYLNIYKYILSNILNSLVLPILLFFYICGDFFLHMSYDSKLQTHLGWVYLKNQLLRNVYSFANMLLTSARAQVQYQ